MIIAYLRSSKQILFKVVRVYCNKQKLFRLSFTSENEGERLLFISEEAIVSDGASASQV